MGATNVDLEKPKWANPVDTDLDAIRDNFAYLLCVAVAGAEVAPGWITNVDVSENNNYAQPDSINLTKGTREIRIGVEWA